MCARPSICRGPLTVAVRTGRINRLLGTSLSDADVARLLAPIGFVAVPAGVGGAADGGGGAGGVQLVTIPTWRPDSEREIDVVEEVARLYGYRRIERTLPPGIRTGGGLTPYQRERRVVRDVLAGAGLSEAWTTTFRAGATSSGPGCPATPSRWKTPWTAPSPCCAPRCSPAS